MAMPAAELSSSPARPSVRITTPPPPPLCLYRTATACRPKSYHHHCCPHHTLSASTVPRPDRYLRYPITRITYTRHFAGVGASALAHALARARVSSMSVAPSVGTFAASAVRHRRVGPINTACAAAPLLIPPCCFCTSFALCVDVGRLPARPLRCVRTLMCLALLYCTNDMPHPVSGTDAVSNRPVV